MAQDDSVARIAVATSEAKVRFFEGDLSTSRFTLDGHGDDVDALAFAPGTQLLATGGRDRSVILWHGQPRQWTIRDVDLGWIRALTIDPTASFVLVSGHRAVTSRWSLKRDDWLAHGQRVLPDGWQSQCRQ